MMTARFRTVLLDDARRDLTLAVRGMRNAPLFAATAVLALALGIGATTAILTVVSGVLLRPLPYAQSDRLVVVLHDGRSPVAPANYLDWKAQSRAFSEMGAAEYWSPDLTGGDDPRQVLGLHVTPSLMRLLGVSPMMGRLFTDADVRSEATPVLISHRLWQTQFGGASNVIGRGISLNGRTYTVVGVMPSSFHFAPFWATAAELWAPLDLEARTTNRGGQSLRVFARLAPAVTLARAQSDVDAITRRLEREYPGTNRDVRVVALRDKVIGSIREPLLLLLVAVCFILLIACSNVAHMLLARASARAKEIAVRLAIGATPFRVFRQLLTESAMLAAVGGLVGVGLAFTGVRALVAFQPAFVPRVATVDIDWRVLAAAFVLVGMTTVLAGVMPALEAVRIRPAEMIRDASGGSSVGRPNQRLRDALVISEFALALVLVVGSGLMIRSFIALRSVDPGFDPRNVITMRVATTGTPAADSNRHAAFYSTVLAQLRTSGALVNASFINHLPIAGDAWGQQFYPEAGPAPRLGDWPRATYRVVMPGYFATMRLSVLRGRDVAESDRAGTIPIAVINEYMARKHWPGRNPIGQRFVLGDSTRVTVVGVVANAVRQEWSAPAEEEFYVPFAQQPDYVAGTGASRYMTLVARVRCGTEKCDAAAAAALIRAAVRSIEHGAPISEVQTMTDVVRRATADARLYFLLLTAFAVVGAILAAIGIYGVISYSVARRRRELGIRVALGARAEQILAMVVLRGVLLASTGVALGCLLAFPAAKAMRALLYGVTAFDPTSVVAAVLAMIGTAAVASAVPAARAAGIDPASALRAD
jgi:putative ABC transport system permease protein